MAHYRTLKIAKISCIEDVKKDFELIKQKHPEEVDYFNEFGEPHCR